MRLRGTWSVTCYLYFFKKQKSARKKRDNTQRQLWSGRSTPLLSSVHAPGQSCTSCGPTVGSLLTQRPRLLTVCTRTTVWSALQLQL